VTISATLEPRDIDCALEVLERMDSSGAADFSLVAEMVTVLVHGRGPLPSTAPPFARALRDLMNGDPESIDRFHRSEVERLDGCVDSVHAVALADRLHRDDLLPRYRRLPSLLAVHDVDRLLRLADDAARVAGRRSAVWADCVIEGVFAMMDAGLEPPQRLEEELRALTSDPSVPNEEKNYDIRLRLAARRNPHAALSMLEEASGNVGYDAVLDGVGAVLGRLARLDRAALASYLDEHTYSLDERVCAFSSAVWEHPMPEDRDRLVRLADALEHDPRPGGLFPREYMVASCTLVEVAARLGMPDVAARIIEFAGPPEWTILSFTGSKCRKRGLEGDGDAISFLDRIAGSMPRAGQGRASIDQLPPPVWAAYPSSLRLGLWRLLALPIPKMPWWSPWGAGLP